MMQEKNSQIIEIIEREIKPMLKMHLGSVDFVNFEDGVVSVRFSGTCVGCPLSNLTLKAGIESILKEKIKSVREVRAIA